MSTIVYIFWNHNGRIFYTCVNNLIFKRIPMFGTSTSLKKGNIVTKLYRINIYVKRLEYVRLVLTKIVCLPII